jgi:hypothetical protein
MGVLTGFHRLSPEAIRTLTARPELLDWVVGRTDDPADGTLLGYLDGAGPTWTGIDKSWDDILRVLSGTDEETALAVLDIDCAEEFEDEVRLYTESDVKLADAVFQEMRTDQIRELALERELTTYNGDPIAHEIDYVIGHLETIIDFWHEAAQAGDAIVSAAS